MTRKAAMSLTMKKLIVIILAVIVLWAMINFIINLDNEWSKILGVL